MHKPISTTNAIRDYTVILGVFASLLAAPAFSQQRYNPQTGSYEVATPNAELRYNPNGGGWNYVEPTPPSASWNTPNRPDAITPSAQLPNNSSAPYAPAKPQNSQALPKR